MKFAILSLSVDHKSVLMTSGARDERRIGNPELLKAFPPSGHVLRPDLAVGLFKWDPADDKVVYYVPAEKILVDVTAVP